MELNPANVIFNKAFGSLEAGLQKTNYSQRPQGVQVPENSLFLLLYTPLFRSENIKNNASVFMGKGRGFPLVNRIGLLRLLEYGNAIRNDL